MRMLSVVVFFLVFTHCIACFWWMVGVSMKEKGWQFQDEVVPLLLQDIDWARQHPSRLAAEPTMAADADAMPGCYHPGTRLTAPAPDLDAASSPAGHAGVFLIPFDDFMRRVGARPNTEEDPRVKRYDNRCVAFSSGGSSSALVVCHIAYPPILFTDVLTLLEFADEPGGGGGGGSCARAPSRPSVRRRDAKISSVIEPRVMRIRR